MRFKLITHEKCITGNVAVRFRKSGLFFSALRRD